VHNQPIFSQYFEVNEMAQLLSLLAENPAIKTQEDTRMESLELLISLLQKAQKADLIRQEFAALFSYSVNVLELDQETVARKFKISRPTVSRWETGASAPHQLGRKPVFMLLQKIAKEKLRQHDVTTSVVY